MVTTRKLFALAAVGALTLAACGSSSDDTGSSGTAAPGVTDAPNATDAPMSTDASGTTDVPGTTDGGGTAAGATFAVDTSTCDDADAAMAPIEGPLKIGSSVPLSGQAAAVFAPLGGSQQAYISYYNDEFGGIGGDPIELSVKDDQYQADITKTNVDELVFDVGVNMLSGIVGTPNNLAVRDDLNAQCIPQLNALSGAPEWGDIDNYPWTSGLLVPYELESRIWGEYVASQLGEGATIGLFYANNEFGQAYASAIKDVAAENGLKIVAEETIDPADSGAPSGQMTNLVQAAPDAILSVPLGTQCIAFMTELGNAQAANPGFDPLTYLTATCSDSIFFTVANNGGADGVFTSSNVKDPANPAVASDEGMKTYLDAMAKYAPDANAKSQIAIAGWLTMEFAVKAAQEAFDAGDYSRAGIINAARNVDYSPGLLLDGLTAKMNADDAYISEGTQLVQWSDASASLVPVGDVNNYEGTTGVFGR